MKLKLSMLSLFWLKKITEVYFDTTVFASNYTQKEKKKKNIKSQKNVNCKLTTRVGTGRLRSDFLWLRFKQSHVCNQEVVICNYKNNWAVYDVFKIIRDGSKTVVGFKV